MVQRPPLLKSSYYFNFLISNFRSHRLPPQGIASGRGMRGGNSRGAPPLVGPGDYGKFWPAPDFRRSI